MARHMSKESNAPRDTWNLGEARTFQISALSKVERSDLIQGAEGLEVACVESEFERSSSQ